MPLVSGTTWFDGDTGDSRRPTPPRRTPEPFADPTAATLIPGPLPSGAPAWSLPEALRRATRPRPLRIEQADFPWPELASVNQFPSWQGELLLPPRRRSPRPPEPPALVLLPPDSPALAWNAVPDQLWPRRIPRRVPDVLEFCPIWTFGTGQPVPPLAWAGDDGSLRRRPGRPAVNDAGWTPLLAVTDIPVTLIGWHVSEPATRARRPALRLAEDPALPLAAWFAGAPLWDASLQPPPPPPRRRDPWRPFELPSLPPLDALLDTPTWLPAFQPVDVLRRVRRLAEVFQFDASPMEWLAAQAAIGRQWGPWAQQPDTLVRARRVPALELHSLVVTPAEAAFWLPPSDDGSLRRTARQSRQSGGLLAGLSSYSEVAAPPWLATGGVIVAGPYYCVAGGVWCAGAVEGKAESAD